jgi:sugar phosphate isomerase/epimerase
MTSAISPRTRREVLAGLASCALAPLHARNSIYRPKLVLGTAIWLQEMESRKKPLADGLEEVCAGIQRAGYRSMEVMPAFLEPSLRDRSIALFHKFRLEPTILYATGPVEQQGPAEATRARVLDTALRLRDAGAAYVNFRAAPKLGGARKTDEELQIQSYQINRLGRELNDAGMLLLVHHQMAEMRDNAREWRYALGHTETPLASFCLDVDCATRAGLQPLELMEFAGGRLAALYLRNTRDRKTLEEMADGDIDMARIATYLHQVFYEGFLVMDLAYDADMPRRHSLPVALSLSRLYMQKMFSTQPGSMPANMGPHVRGLRH